MPGSRARPSISGSSVRSEEHTSELQSRLHLVCRLLLEKKKKKHTVGSGEGSRSRRTRAADRTELTFRGATHRTLRTSRGSLVLVSSSMNSLRQPEHTST